MSATDASTVTTAALSGLRELVAAEFPRSRARGYLDTATYGLPPQRTLDALAGAVEQWRDGAPLTVWEEDGERCRELFAELLGVAPEVVALTPAVSVAAGLVAATLEPAPGANLVVHEREFASNLATPLEHLADAVDDRTTLVAVSAVQFSDGAVVDLEPFKASPALLFVDATQALGAVPVDLRGVDFVAAAAYKWLLGPRGICVLSVAPDRVAGIRPWFAGWKSRRDPFDTSFCSDPPLADDARRLDVSLPWLLTGGLRSSLELVAEAGIDRVGAHNMSLARELCAGLGLPVPSSPIVKARVTRPLDAAASLASRGVTALAHSDGVRVGFHLYNDETDVRSALDALAPFAEGVQE